MPDSKREHTDAEEFSAQSLRDRVVIMLLFDQIVGEEDVERAWRIQQQPEHRETPLWRVLAQMPEVDTELVYAEAARVYGFEEADIVRRVALALVEETQRRVDPSVWERLADGPLLPVAEETQPHSHQRRLVFATPDPTRPDVQRLLHQVGFANFELCYASTRQLHELLAEAFPDRYGHLGDPDHAVEALGPFRPREVPDVPTEENVEEVERGGASAQGISRSSLMSALEHILERMVRGTVDEVYVLANDEGDVVAYGQEEGELQQWEVTASVPAHIFLGALRRRVIQAEGDDRQRDVQRWIDGSLVRFRVRWSPAGDELPQEAVFIRRLP